MKTLRDFIEQRRHEIRSEIARLKAELRELSLAESAIRTGVVAESDREQVRLKEEKRTIKEMVLVVLASRPEGAEASEIIEMIASTFGEEVARPSLSPQLSRLKEEGALTLEGRVWKKSTQTAGPEELPSGPETSHGRGTEQVRALPTEPPEGASPSTSTLNRPNINSTDGDDDPNGGNTWS